MGLYFEKQKKILKRLLVGTSLFAIGLLAFSLVSFISGRFFHLGWIRNPFFLVLMMSVICIVLYRPLDLVVTKLFRHYLFKKKSYGQMMLMDLAEELAVVLDLRELANLVVNTFGEVLYLKTVALLVPSRSGTGFEIASAYGWSVFDTKRVSFPQDSPLLQLIRSHGGHVLVRDREIRTVSWQEATRLARDFDSIQASWLIPLFVKRKLVGAIGFSGSNPDATFHEEDFQFFRQFADPVAKAVHNALKFSGLQWANEELQDVQSKSLQAAKVSAIERLATGIAHEIHNPLTVISGKAQILLLKKDKEFLDEQIEEVLKTIVKQTKRAADITRKLLMFSQSSGAPKEPLKLEQVLDDTVSLVSYQTSLGGIEVSRAIGNRLPPFYANVHELREVFLNLIMNAVQSIGAEGKIHCNLRYLEKDRIFEITISDTGRGIPKENIDKLFDPFFTTRPDGVGLGLFVTRQIVHRYGGSIRAESSPGHGSLFTVRFPYVELGSDMVREGGEGKEKRPLFPSPHS